MKLSEAPSILKQTFNEWSADKGPRLGAALAYYAVFSIPPLMMIALAVLGFMYRGNIAGRLETQLAGLVGAETAKTLLTGVEFKGLEGGITASLLGIGILIFGASGVFGELQDAMNTIWGVKPRDEGLKGLVKGRFTSFTMVLGTCFLLLISLVVGAIVAALSEEIGAWIPGGETIGRLVDFLASFAIITAVFAMMFKVVPDVELRWSDVWPGAIVTSLLFTIGKFIIGTYIGQAGIGSAYGAAGSIVILITWIYYSAQILYFGAELTQVYAQRYGSLGNPKANAKRIQQPVKSPPENPRQIRPA